MRTTFYKALAMAALFVPALVSCSGKKSADVEIVEEKAQTVNTQKVLPVSLSDYIEFGGNILARNSVDVYSPVAGKITRIYVKVGDKVSANQIIAEVDSSRPGAVYAASPVRASISGSIVSLEGTVGAQVSASSVLASIGQIENLEVNVNVPERFSSLLKMNQSALISVPALPGEQFDSYVKEISPVIETGSRTVSVVLSFGKNASSSTKTDARLKAGMSAKVHLITQTLENVIAIPSKAIVVRGDETFVFVAVENGTKAQKRIVETGIKVDSLTEIKSGLNEGDMLLVKGQTLVDDGQKINAIEISAQ